MKNWYLLWAGSLKRFLKRNHSSDRTINIETNLVAPTAARVL